MAKGPRGNADASHVRIYDAMMKSAAWRALSGNAVKALLHVASFEKPASSPNGSLFMSWVALASGIGVSRNTAGRALRELVDMGFLRVTSPGHFKVKGGPASTYRLTWRSWPGKMGPTNEWRDWRAAEIIDGSNNCARAGAKITPLSDLENETGVKFAPAEARKRQKPVNPTGPIIALHTIASGKAFSGTADEAETPEIDPLNTGGPNLASDASPQLRAFADRMVGRA